MDLITEQCQRAIDMDLYESHLHSFIIKLRLEEGTEELKRTAWSGQIKHIPGGEYRYVRSLEEISDFIRPYLTSAGVDIDE